ncbi:hypothetical protein Scep_005094 [Stephania cephalantha]|uniref:Uncharacterized protein n=1 Tax=Stephania cephalantha TaxID=152367 RepID=A0AAP0KW74_9MAGN
MLPTSPSPTALSLQPKLFAVTCDWDCCVVSLLLPKPKLFAVAAIGASVDSARCRLPEIGASEALTRCLLFRRFPKPSPLSPHFLSRRRFAAP